MRHLPTTLLLAAACLAAPASSRAGAPPDPTVATTETLAQQFDGEVEVRLDADFNADDIDDVAVVLRKEDADKRWLVVALGYRNETDFGQDPVDSLAMDPYPLGDATLSAKKGVLVVEDLTGGTSAVASTYRFRYDPAEHRMRLIGDDVQYYSRTNQHDTVKISTNRLTGLRIRSGARLTEDGDYAPLPEIREKVDTAPIYMDAAPDPSDTLGLGE